MRKNKKYLFYTLLSVVLLISCKDPHEYKIDPAFADYLQRFENEGTSRGHNLNPQTTGLIMEFGTLSSGTAGLTHYETPVRIQFDKAYWDDISNNAGSDFMKEDLVFHELGHALLNRSHLNSTLANDDWKSIMCGGDKVNNRPWNIDYKGERRKYYLDELFDINTVEPAFASMTLPVDTTGFTTDILRTFDNASQAIWKDTLDNNHQISLDNGQMRFQSKVNSSYLVFVKIPTPISVNSTFSYELTFHYPPGNDSNQYGVLFGPVALNSNGTNDPIEYFTINNSQKMQMGNRSWYSFYTELTESSISLAGFNKLKVFKIGTSLYYFINNVYCYTTEMEANASINEFGFVAPPLSTIWIDNFKISHKGLLAAPALKIKQNQLLEINIQKVDNFIPKTIKNQ